MVASKGERESANYPERAKRQPTNSSLRLIIGGVGWNISGHNLRLDVFSICQSRPRGHVSSNLAPADPTRKEGRNHRNQTSVELANITTSGPV